MIKEGGYILSGLLIIGLVLALPFACYLDTKDTSTTLATEKTLLNQYIDNHTNDAAASKALEYITNHTFYRSIFINSSAKIESLEVTDNKYTKEDFSVYRGDPGIIYNYQIAIVFNQTYYSKGIAYVAPHVVYVILEEKAEYRNDHGKMTTQDPIVEWKFHEATLDGKYDMLRWREIWAERMQLELGS